MKQRPHREEQRLPAGIWSDHAVRLFLGSVYDDRSPAQKICANVKEHVAVCPYCSPEKAMGWACEEAARVWLKSLEQEASCCAAQTLIRFELDQVIATFTGLLRGRPKKAP